MAADTLSVANHPLWTDYLKDELSAINTPVVAPDPATDGFTSFSPTARAPIKVGDVSLAFDPATGALSQLDVEDDAPLMHIGISEAEVLKIKTSDEVIYKDDLTGQILCPTLVREARRKEL